MNKKAQRVSIAEACGWTERKCLLDDHTVAVKLVMKPEGSAE